MGVLAKPIPFGDYYLLEKINTGGMAEVFKAKTFGVKGFERIVAVKKILPSISEDEEFITMFIDEAKIAVQLTHANIAQVFDLGNIDDQYYIAMEYVSGRDLRVIYDRCSRSGQKLDIPCVCYIISEICKGLDYAHNKKSASGEPLGIIHRDISPQNILISYDGECKLIDFGIAKAANKTNATQVGILKGKFSYMSPEQVAGKTKIDCRSDVFALGIVLFEILTLKRLFLGSSDFSTLEKIRKVEVSPPTLYNPNIPEDLEEIVLKALDKDVNQRYQSAAELSEALQRFMIKHNMFYTAKDLSEFMQTLFAKEIVLEQQKTDYYKDLTLEKLKMESARNASAANMAVEDETSCYNAQNVQQVVQSPQKRDIIDELDNFVPPTDDIIYSNKPSTASVASGPVVAKTPSVDAIGLTKDESLSELAAKPLAMKGAMPAPRKSMSSLSSVVVASAKERETVAGVAPVKPMTSSKMRLVFVSVIVVLFVVIALLLGVWISKKYDPNDGVLSFVIYPENVPMELELNGENVPHGDQVLLSGTITLEGFSRRNETHYRVLTGDAYSVEEGSVLATQDGETVQIRLQPKAAFVKFFVNQPGAMVKVDGSVVSGEDANTQNYTLDSLTPGEHFVEVSKDRYKTDSRKIVLKQGDNETLIFTLVPRYASLKLVSEPDGTEFTLRNKKTGDTQRVKSGSIIDDLVIDDTYEISYRDGGETMTRSWMPRTDGSLDTRTFVVKPEPVVEEAPKPRVETEAPRVAAAPKPKASAAENTETPKPKPKPKAENTAAADSGAPGIFKISSKPPCEVFINGTNYGTTPIKKELPAGTYKIRFVNAEAGIDSTQTEVLGSGADVKVTRK